MVLHTLFLGDNMFKKNWKTYVGWIVATEAIGLASGLLTMNAMEHYKNEVIKPPLSPPAILFPIVWVILYALMGYGAALVSLNTRGKDRSIAIGLYLAQIMFNFFWSIIFFNREDYLFALIWIILLLVLIIAMTIYFRRVSKTAAYLQIPYIIWVAFATYLNAGVLALNG